jgi:hypothetical protein
MWREQEIFSYGDVGAFSNASSSTTASSAIAAPSGGLKNKSWSSVARLEEKDVVRGQQQQAAMISSLKPKDEVSKEFIDSEIQKKEFSEEPCRFFFSSRGCAKGHKCRFSHQLKVAEEALKEETAAMTDTKLNCGICLSRPKVFGILSTCDHIFCISCIRSWRATSNDASLPRETSKSCPVCRLPVYIIVPSSEFVSDPEKKEELIRNYREKLSHTRCRNLQTAEGCPFGESCLYSHADGTVFANTKKKFVKNADGRVVALPM